MFLRNVSLAVFAAVTAQSAAAATAWTCRSASDELEEHVITFLTGDRDAVQALRYFDNDSWYELTCEGAERGAVPLSGIQNLCLAVDAGAIRHATIEQRGRMFGKVVSLLEVDRFSNVATTSEYFCQPE